MASSPLNCRLIIVKNSNGKSKAAVLDLNASLTTIREQVTDLGVMTSDDVFVIDGTAVETTQEGVIRLSDLVNDRQLAIGAPGSITQGKLDYLTMDRNQKLAYLGSGISKVNVFHGLSVEKPSDRVQFVRKSHPLYRFSNDYMPDEMKPTLVFDFESLLTFSEEGHTMQTSGVSKTTISLKTKWGSGEASYEHAKKETTTTNKVRSYFTERHVCNKISLSIDPEKMIPDYQFIQKVKTAVAGDAAGVDKYQALVEVLNEYGWYVPLQFTLGSALYATKTIEVDTYSHATEESTKFEASFKAEFKGIEAGGGHSEENKTENKDDKEDKKEQIVFNQIGGSVIGKEDFPKWVESLKDAKEWDIIRYSKLYPSLMLLPDEENATFSACLRILRQYNSNRFVKPLQRFIDVGDYEYEIAKQVVPEY